jgi:hypothetical protein
MNYYIFLRNLRKIDGDLHILLVVLVLDFF